jgi:hypothetical protein
MLTVVGLGIGLGTELVAAEGVVAGGAESTREALGDEVQAPTRNPRTKTARASMGRSGWLFARRISTTSKPGFGLARYLDI